MKVVRSVLAAGVRCEGSGYIFMSNTVPKDYKPRSLDRAARQVEVDCPKCGKRVVATSLRNGTRKVATHTKAETVAFNPTGWDGGRGGDNPFFRFVAAAERLKLKYDIQDDSFQVFFPPTTTNHPNGNVMSVLLGTHDGERWYVAAEHKKTGAVIRPIPAYLWPLSKIGQEADRWMKTWGVTDHTLDIVNKYLELAQ